MIHNYKEIGTNWQPSYKAIFLIYLLFFGGKAFAQNDTAKKLPESYCISAEDYKKGIIAVAEYIHYPILKEINHLFLEGKIEESLELRENTPHLLEREIRTLPKGKYIIDNISQYSEFEVDDQNQFVGDLVVKNIDDSKPSSVVYQFENGKLRSHSLKNAEDRLINKYVYDADYEFANVYYYNENKNTGIPYKMSTYDVKKEQYVKITYFHSNGKIESEESDNLKINYDEQGQITYKMIIEGNKMKQLYYDNGLISKEKYGGKYKGSNEEVLEIDYEYKDKKLLKYKKTDYKKGEILWYNNKKQLIKKEKLKEEIRPNYIPNS